MVGSKKQDFWLKIRVGYKEWVNTVERLRDSSQKRPLTVLRVAVFGKNHATFLQCYLTPYNPLYWKSIYSKETIVFWEYGKHQFVKNWAWF